MWVWRSSLLRSGTELALASTCIAECHISGTLRLLRLRNGLEPQTKKAGLRYKELTFPPKGGRCDGEDSNYGLVDISDSPYQEFDEALRAANLAAIETHKKAVP